MRGGVKIVLPDSFDEGEPILKKHRVAKFVLEPPACLNVCGVSRDVWFERILKENVLLVDLIVIKRTCKAFATYKPLRWLIKAKVEAAFGDPKITPTCHWNRVTRCSSRDHRSVVTDEFATHKFILFVEDVANFQPYKRTYRLGVFSHKSALLKALLFLFSEYTFSQRGEIYGEIDGYIEMRFMHGIIYVRGLDLKELKTIIE